MKKQFIEVVILHAVDNYEIEGWDILVECWSDDEIWDVIKSATSEQEAIELALQALGPINDFREDIVNA